METDDPPTISPLVSQYGAQHYAPNACTTTATEQPSDPVHMTPEHNIKPVHSSLSDGSPVTCPALYDTSAPPLNLHDSLGPEPKSPTFVERLSPGVQIDSPLSEDPVTPTQPKYDSSSHTASRRACLFLLSPLAFTPDKSPNKSSDSISGFAPHAASVNAFSATATSNPPVSTSTIPIPQVHLIYNYASTLVERSIPNLDALVLQEQPLEDIDVTELSDGSPPPRVPAHIPCMEENYVAKTLVKCPNIPAPALISPLPQIEWDIFERSISKFGEA